MDIRYRINAVIVLWFILAAAVAAANFGKPIEAGGVILALIVGMAGVEVTRLISSIGEGAAQSGAASKAKRQNRVDALLDLLSDDDLEALRRRLSDAVDEGEPVALDQMVAEDGELRLQHR